MNKYYQLLVENSNTIDLVRGTFGNTLMKRSNALLVTLQNKTLDLEQIEICKDIIKKNQSVFSNFRGNNLLTTAIYLSQERNPEQVFEEIVELYKELKEYFFSSEYLVLAAWVLYHAKERMIVNEAVKKTREAYDYMKNKHFFITGSEDVVSAAMIATTSNDLKRTFEEIDATYTVLSNNGLKSYNNLQALSHILALSNESVEVKCKKVIDMDHMLRTMDLKLNQYALPILGILSIVIDEPKKFTIEMSKILKQLEDTKGFGMFSITALFRKMIAAALVTATWIEENPTFTQHLNSIMSNTTLSIVIAMETATIAATTGAIAAASSAS